MANTSMNIHVTKSHQKLDFIFSSPIRSHKLITIK